MRDTSKVDRTMVVDGIQELSKREMEDVMGGFIARGGDGNADGLVDGADLSRSRHPSAT